MHTSVGQHDPNMENLWDVYVLNILQSWFEPRPEKES